MHLSPHFTLREMTFSQTAMRLGIPNVPGPVMVNRLRSLCKNILEPVRKEFGPFSPTSGYRGSDLNEILGGSKNSQHMMGEAADFKPFGACTLMVAEWIERELDFDQLILEYFDPKLPDSGWVHCSYTARDRRDESLTKVPGEKGYRKGLLSRI